jgi:3-oxoacyl-[acyl-carrier protein] reductase
MINQCIETFGKIDILVNVAGNLRERMIWNMSEDDFDAVVAVHLKGHWNMCHHAVKYMRRAGFGRIVNFSSDAFKGSVGQCNYSAAKAGIIGLTRSIARETYKNGITANAVCPSADTRMTVNDAVIANRKRRFEAGLLTKEQYARTLLPRGPEYIALGRVSLPIRRTASMVSCFTSNAASSSPIPSARISRRCTRRTMTDCLRSTS